MLENVGLGGPYVLVDTQQGNQAGLSHTAELNKELG